MSEKWTGWIETPAEKFRKACEEKKNKALDIPCELCNEKEAEKYLDWKNEAGEVCDDCFYEVMV
jgi:hypothetical protein